MLSFTTDSGLRFNYRVAGAAYTGGHVLLHKSDRDDFWSLPGGRVEGLEPSATSLARELREELGADATVERPLWIVENFFVYRGQPFHELGFYYLVTLPPAYCDPTRTMQGTDLTQTRRTLQLTFRWFALNELDDLTIYPSFLKTALVTPPDTVVHLVHRDP
ncbi:MAG: NUDIX hydrolase [Trueperaceae bacterium]|nr:NUDIX hydrolase [Trueperaceae bacterium]